MVEISKKYLEDLSGDLHKMEAKLGPVTSKKLFGPAVRKFEAGWERFVRVFTEHKWISRQQHEINRLDKKVLNLAEAYEKFAKKIEKGSDEANLKEFLDLNKQVEDQLNTMSKICDRVKEKADTGKVRTEDFKKVTNWITRLQDICKYEDKKISAMIEGGKKPEGKKSHYEKIPNLEEERRKDYEKLPKMDKEEDFSKLRGLFEEEETETVETPNWRGEDFVDLEEESVDLEENPFETAEKEAKEILSEGAPEEVASKRRRSPPGKHEQLDLTNAAKKLQESEPKVAEPPKQTSKELKDFEDLSKGLKDALSKSPKGTGSPKTPESPKGTPKDKQKIDLSSAQEKLEKLKEKETAQLSDIAIEEKIRDILKQAIRNIVQEIKEDKSLDQEVLKTILQDNPAFSNEDYAILAKNTLKTVYAEVSRKVPEEYIRRIDKVFHNI